MHDREINSSKNLLKTPRQDVPIMIFTLEQWSALQKEDFFTSAAPIGPSKLGCNSVYVFALPARYNYAFQTGFEEKDNKGNRVPPGKYTITVKILAKIKNGKISVNELTAVKDIDIN